MYFVYGDTKDVGIYYCVIDSELSAIHICRSCVAKSYKSLLKETTKWIDRWNLRLQFEVW